MDDLRAELASLVASFGAWVSLHEATGTQGFPRETARPREVGASVGASNASGPTAAGQQMGDVPARPEQASPAPQAQPVPSAGTVAGGGPPTPVDEPVPSSAKALHEATALPAVTFEGLADSVAKCTLCTLHACRKAPAVLRGSHSPRLVFVAENPSADDDLTGIPFSGARGELLDRMIGAMGLDPNADVAVILVTKCFAGDGDGGRASSPAQLAACSSYLHAQLALLAPKAVVALGEVAAVALVGGALGAPPRGEWKAYRGRLPVMPTLALSTFSESADARAKQAKKLVWDDLQKVMDHLGLPRKRQ